MKYSLFALVLSTAVVAGAGAKRPVHFGARQLPSPTDESDMAKRQFNTEGQPIFPIPRVHSSSADRPSPSTTATDRSGGRVSSSAAAEATPEAIEPSAERSVLSPIRSNAGR